MTAVSLRQHTYREVGGCMKHARMGTHSLGNSDRSGGVWSEVGLAHR